jgi:hypothetical protein
MRIRAPEPSAQPFKICGVLVGLEAWCDKRKKVENKSAKLRGCMVAKALS